MRVKCTESRRIVRRWAARRQIVSYADDKNHDSPILILELRLPNRWATDSEGRILVKKLGWGERETLQRQRQAESELELEEPLGSTVSRLASLYSAGKLRAVS